VPVPGRRIATAIAALVALAAFAAAARFLGRRGEVTDDPRLPGRWIAPALALDLDPGGRYWLAGVASAGELALEECGRWHAVKGQLQMRVARGTAGEVSALAPAALRYGDYRLRDGTLAVELRRGRTPLRSLSLAREEKPLPARFSGLERDCGAP